MKLIIPDKNHLIKTGEVDYFHWYYNFPMSLIQKYRFRKIIELLGAQNYTNLLEAGIGSGIFLPELSKHCVNLYGIDIHDKLDHINKLCEIYKLKNYNLSKQSIESTNFPDNYFDAIVTSSVLEFVNDVDAAIQEIKRILKKNGILITICPRENKLIDFFLSFYTRKSVKEEFGKSRTYVPRMLEENFNIICKGNMLPVIDKFFPIYTYYKLNNSK